MQWLQNAYRGYALFKQFQMSVRPKSSILLRQSMFKTASLTSDTRDLTSRAEVVVQYREKVSICPGSDHKEAQVLFHLAGIVLAPLGLDHFQFWYLFTPSISWRGAMLHSTDGKMQKSYALNFCNKQTEILSHWVLNA